jgi:hypothetical protein
MSRRKARKLVLAGYLLAGAFMTQFLTLCSSAATAGAASSGLLVDNNGYFLGLLYVCGSENFYVTDETGVPGPVQNSEDDLMYGCPAQAIVVPPP